MQGDGKINLDKSAQEKYKSSSSEKDKILNASKKNNKIFFIFPPYIFGQSVRIYFYILSEYIF